MKKHIFLLLTGILLCLSLTACTTSKSYKFTLTNGEEVEVELDTSDGLKMKQKEGIFTVSKGKDEILTGMFMSPDFREKQTAAVNETPDAVIIRDDNEEFVWSINGEYNRIINLHNAENYMLIASKAEQSLAEDTYHKLKITVLKGNGDGKDETVSPEPSSVSEPETVETPSEEPVGITEEPSESVSVPTEPAAGYREPSTKGEQEAVDYARQTAIDLHLSKKDLLDNMAYSADSMPHATSADYEYAIEYLEKTGMIDWDSQALDKAFDYLNTDPNYTKDSLKEQLIQGDNFTESEAEYGASGALGE